MRKTWKTFFKLATLYVLGVTQALLTYELGGYWYLIPCGVVVFLLWKFSKEA